MRLRTKILLSYAILIGIISCGIYTILDFAVINGLTKEHIAAARDGVYNMSRLNSLNLQRNLRELGEVILDQIAQKDAVRAALYLKDKSPDYWKDYNALRQDSEFRKIVAHPIIVYKKEAGFTDCLDSQGLAVVHPLPNVEGHNYSEWAKAYPEMWSMVQDAPKRQTTSGYYRFINAQGEAEDKFMVICRIQGTDLFLTASVFIDSYFTPAKARILAGENSMIEYVNKRIKSSSLDSSRRVKILSLPVIGGIALLCALFGLWFAAGITRPLHRLLDAVNNIGQGNFSVKIPEEGVYETVQLSKTFNQLGKRLAEYTESLKHEAAAREAVESEIKIARSIQESLLPKKFPAGEWFELAAVLRPAKEVAGDFYDCFERNGKLYMIIGDVSGKGVPAAFFMGVIRTMLRDIFHNETDPGKVLSIANRHLCVENETCMFVTLFLAVYDLETGVLTFANGGHNELLSLNGNQATTTFGFTGDMALGIVAETEFKTRQRPVNVGETIIFYTDGVTEAVSTAQILYGIERLQTVARTNVDKSTRELCEAIADDAIAYENGARFDDITVMAFRRKN